MSRAGSDSGTRATPRRSLSAFAINSSAALIRASQLESALHPSSSRITSGALEPASPVCGFQIGPAAAKITSAAANRRNAVSHHGVRDGVSSFGAMSNKSRVGGNSTRRGRGGLTRNSHHSTARPTQPGQAQQAQQQKWFGERERQPGDHALRPALTVAVRALPLLTIMPLCRNSSSSAAERLVVWVENSQSSLLVSLRISSR